MQHHYINAVLYAIIVLYIVFLNYSSYEGRNMDFLRMVTDLFTSKLFVLLLLAVVAYLSLDLHKIGGFTLAILLTIAFLNTLMIMNKRRVDEGFTAVMEYMTNKEDEKKETENFENEEEEEGDEVKEQPANIPKPMGEKTLGHLSEEGFMDYNGAYSTFGPEGNDTYGSCSPGANSCSAPFNLQGHLPDNSLIGPSPVPENYMKAPSTESRVAYEMG